MMNRTHFAGLSIFLAFFGMNSLAIADDHWSDDWKISVTGKSSSAGTMSFKLTFEPGEDGAAADPVSIDVAIAEGTRDNDVAALITNNFQAALGDDDFNIDQSWGEHILVKTRGKAPDFALELTGNTVQSVSVEIDD